GALTADVLGDGDRCGGVLPAGELPGGAAGRALESELGFQARPGDQYDDHHQHHHGQHDRGLRRGGPPVVPEQGRPGGPRHHAPFDRAEVMMAISSSRTSPDASRATRTAAKPQAASTVMAYSAVEAPVSSRIARSRVRRIRCRVRDMGSSFGSRAEGPPPGAAGAAWDATADAAAGWRPQPPCTGPERAGAPGRARWSCAPPGARGE